MATGSISELKDKLEKVIGVLDATGNRFDSAAISAKGLDKTVRDANKAFADLVQTVTDRGFIALAGTFHTQASAIFTARREMDALRAGADRAAVAAKMLSMALDLSKPLKFFGQLSQDLSRLGTQVSDVGYRFSRAFSSPEKALGNYRETLLKFNRDLYETSRISSTLGRQMVFNPQLWRTVEQGTTLSRVAFVNLYRTILENSRGMPMAAIEFAKFSKVLVDQFGGSVTTIEEKMQRFLSLQNMLPNIRGQMDIFREMNKTFGKGIEPRGMRETLFLLGEMGADNRSLDFFMQYTKNVTSSERALMRFENAVATRNKTIENSNLRLGKSMEETLITIEQTMTKLTSTLTDVAEGFEKVTKAMSVMTALNVAAPMMNLLGSGAMMANRVSGIFGASTLGGMGAVRGGAASMPGAAAGISPAGALGRTLFGGAAVAGTAYMAYQAFAGSRDADARLRAAERAQMDAQFDDEVSKEQRNVRRRETDTARAESVRQKSSAAWTVGGSVTGAVIGGTIGSVVPVFGTATGAAVGSMVGGWAGGAIGGKVGKGKHDKMLEASSQKQALQDTIESLDLGEQKTGSLLRLVDDAAIKNAKDALKFINDNLKDEQKISAAIVYKQSQQKTFNKLKQECNDLGATELNTLIESAKKQEEDNRKSKEKNQQMYETKRLYDEILRIQTVTAERAKIWQDSVKSIAETFTTLGSVAGIDKLYEDANKAAEIQLETVRKIKEQLLTFMPVRLNFEMPEDQLNEVFSQLVDKDSVGLVDELTKKIGFLNKRRAESNTGDNEYKKALSDAEGLIEDLVKRSVELGRTHKDSAGYLKEYYGNLAKGSSVQAEATRQSAIQKNRSEEIAAITNVTNQRLNIMTKSYESNVNMLRQQTELAELEKTMIENQNLGMAASMEMQQKIVYLSARQMEQQQQMVRNMAHDLLYREDALGLEKSLVDLGLSKNDQAEVYRGNTDVVRMLISRTVMDEEKRRNALAAAEQFTQRIAQGNKDVLQSQIKIQEMTKTLREGFLDVINEMTTGNDLVTQLMPNAQRGRMAVLDLDRMIKGADFGGAMKVGFASTTQMPGMQAQYAPRYGKRGLGSLDNELQKRYREHRVTPLDALSARFFGTNMENSNIGALGIEQPPDLSPGQARAAQDLGVSAGIMDAGKAFVDTGKRSVDALEQNTAAGRANTQALLSLGEKALRANSQSQVANSRGTLNPSLANVALGPQRDNISDDQSPSSSAYLIPRVNPNPIVERIPTSSWGGPVGTNFISRKSGGPVGIDMTRGGVFPGTPTPGRDNAFAMTKGGPVLVGSGEYYVPGKAIKNKNDMEFLQRLNGGNTSDKDLQLAQENRHYFKLDDGGFVVNREAANKLNLGMFYNRRIPQHRTGGIVMSFFAGGPLASRATTGARSIMHSIQGGAQGINVGGAGTTGGVSAAAGGSTWARTMAGYAGNAPIMAVQAGIIGGVGRSIVENPSQAYYERVRDLQELGKREALEDFMSNRNYYFAEGFKEEFFDRANLYGLDATLKFYGSNLYRGVNKNQFDAMLQKGESKYKDKTQSSASSDLLSGMVMPSLTDFKLMALRGAKKNAAVMEDIRRYREKREKERENMSGVGFFHALETHLVTAGKYTKGSVGDISTAFHGVTTKPYNAAKELLIPGARQSFLQNEQMKKDEVRLAQIHAQREIRRDENAMRIFEQATSVNQLTPDQLAALEKANIPKEAIPRIFNLVKAFQKVSSGTSPQAMESFLKSFAGGEDISGLLKSLKLRGYRQEKQQIGPDKYLTSIVESVDISDFWNLMRSGKVGPKLQTALLGASNQISNLEKLKDQFNRRREAHSQDEVLQQKYRELGDIPSTDPPNVQYDKLMKQQQAISSFETERKRAQKRLEVKDFLTNSPLAIAVRANTGNLTTSKRIDVFRNRAKTNRTSVAYETYKQLKADEAALETIALKMALSRVSIDDPNNPLALRYREMINKFYPNDQDQGGRDGLASTFLERARQRIEEKRAEKDITSLSEEGIDFSKVKNFEDYKTQAVELRANKEAKRQAIELVKQREGFSYMTPEQKVTAAREKMRELLPDIRTQYNESLRPDLIKKYDEKQNKAAESVKKAYDIVYGSMQSKFPLGQGDNLMRGMNYLRDMRQKAQKLLLSTNENDKANGEELLKKFEQQAALFMPSSTIKLFETAIINDKSAGILPPIAGLPSVPARPQPQIEISRKINQVYVEVKGVIKKKIEGRTGSTSPDALSQEAIERLKRLRLLAHGFLSSTDPEKKREGEDLLKKFNREASLLVPQGQIKQLEAAILLEDMRPNLEQREQNSKQVALKQSESRNLFEQTASALLSDREKGEREMQAVGPTVPAPSPAVSDAEKRQQALDEVMLSIVTERAKERGKSKRWGGLISLNRGGKTSIDMSNGGVFPGIPTPGRDNTFAIAGKRSGGTASSRPLLVGAGEYYIPEKSIRTQDDRMFLEKFNNSPMSAYQGGDINYTRAMDSAQKNPTYYNLGGGGFVVRKEVVDRPGSKQVLDDFVKRSAFSGGMIRSFEDGGLTRMEAARAFGGKSGLSSAGSMASSMYFGNDFTTRDVTGLHAASLGVQSGGYTESGTMTPSSASLLLGGGINIDRLYLNGGLIAQRAKGGDTSWHDLEVKNRM